MNKKPIFLELYTDIGFQIILDQKTGKVRQYNSSINEELQAFQTGAAVRDISTHTLLSLKGKDALNFVHRISTNSVKDILVNETVRTTFTNEKGRILDSTLLMRLQETLTIIGSESTEEILSYWLNKYIITDDIAVESLYRKEFAFEITGPQADSLMILLFGETAKKPEEFKVYTVLMDAHAIKFTVQKERNGQKKYIIFGPVIAGRELIRQFKYSSSLFDVRFIGIEAYKHYRIEEGIPGEQELNDKFNPLESNISEEVNFKKGYYIGQEVISRIDTNGKTIKQLRGFILEEKIDNGIDFMIFDEENREVGVLTSIVYSEDRQKSIALGYLKKQLLEQDIRLFIESEKRMLPLFRRNFISYENLYQNRR